MPHREPINIGIAREFLSRSFAPSETIAIVLRRTSPATIVQRIVTLERALQPRYLGWLAHENATGANVYFAANPLVPGAGNGPRKASPKSGIYTSIWTRMERRNSPL